jgi:hypothetical protein
VLINKNNGFVALYANDFLISVLINGCPDYSRNVSADSCDLYCAEILSCHKVCHLGEATKDSSTVQCTVLV